MGARGGAAREVTRAGVRLGNERSNGASTMPSAFPAQMRTAAGKKLASVASGLVGQRGLGVLLDEGLEAGRVGAGKLVHLRLAPEHLHTPPQGLETFGPSARGQDSDRVTRLGLVGGACACLEGWHGGDAAALGQVLHLVHVHLAEDSAGCRRCQRVELGRDHLHIIHSHTSESLADGSSEDRR